MNKNPGEKERDRFKTVAELIQMNPIRVSHSIVKKKKRLLSFYFAVLPNFQQQNRQHLVTRNIIVATHANRKTIASKQWCWCQVGSWNAGWRCLAPLWCLINLIQKIAHSKGFIGQSWWILDNIIAFSL